MFHQIIMRASLYWVPLCCIRFSNQQSQSPLLFAWQKLIETDLTMPGCKMTTAKRHLRNCSINVVLSWKGSDNSHDIIFKTPNWSISVQQTLDIAGFFDTVWSIQKCTPLRANCSHSALFHSPQTATLFWRKPAYTSYKFPTYSTLKPILV